MTTPLHAQLAGLIAERDSKDSLALKIQCQSLIGGWMLQHEAEILAALQQPEGWVMVPVEPTREMIVAGGKAGFFSSSVLKLWGIMLKAAPPL